MTGKEEHFFVIGDWGGIDDVPIVPADNRVPGPNYRHFVHGVDDRAQQRVAAQMKKQAKVSNPRYVINAGDNFYWAGINKHCGSTECCDSTGQFKHIFEEIYKGPGLDEKPWLGVLGNHDYGGWMFVQAWDQAIVYSWSPNSRWVTPALYWAQRMRYPDFVVDFYFIDSNVNDALAPDADPEHNMCSVLHNPQEDASCGVDGPQSVPDCLTWFQRLWNDQVKWLERQLAVSTADWKIVVTHFPPEWMKTTWTWLWKTYGIDLIITGHRHDQEVHEEGNDLPAYIVSGGGGGVTSEGPPDLDGHDDQYGFMDVMISKEQIRIEAISHGGILRSTTKVFPKKRKAVKKVTKIDNSANNSVSTNNTMVPTTTSLPSPPPPAFPKPPPHQAGMQGTETGCRAGDMVLCPGSEQRCEGDQCCPDGSVCPSAFEDFHGCNQNKTVDCTRSSAVPLEARPLRMIPALEEEAHELVHALTGGVLKKFRFSHDVNINEGSSHRYVSWVTGVMLAVAVATATGTVAAVVLRRIRQVRAQSGSRSGTYVHLPLSGRMEMQANSP